MDATADRAAITEFLNRHQLFIDLRDAPGYAGLSTADGALNSPTASKPWTAS